MVEALYEFRNEYIKFPTTVAETMACIETFTDKSRLPNIVGAIDGTHIKIISPRDSAVDYFGRNQQHDFIIQAVADGKGLFLDFAAGYPGSLHDARVYQNSSLYQRASNEEVQREPVERIGIGDIHPYLVGDSAYRYPISPWLMKPYTEATRDPGEITFNKELSSARVAIQCAFGHLKSCWRILQKRLDSRITFSVKVAIACAVLHNFCIKIGDKWYGPPFVKKFRCSEWFRIFVIVPIFVMVSSFRNCSDVRNGSNCRNYFELNTFGLS